MENIIKELIQIESKTDTIIAEAREELKLLDKTLRAREAEIRGNIDKQTDEKISKLNETAKMEAARKITEIKQNSGFLTASLEKLFEQNRSKWEADIVNRIIGT